MELKRILSDIEERFYKGDNVRGEYYEIFKNPSLDEIREVLNDKYEGDEEIRFIADYQEEDVYIASTELVHSDIADLSDLAWSSSVVDKRYFPGIAYYRGTELEVDVYFLECSVGLYNVEKIIDDVLNGEYDYLERYYFNVNKLKREVEEIDL